MSQNSSEPLGVNRGSVRASLAIMSFLAFAISMFVPSVDNGSRTALGVFATTIIKYYFDSRPKSNGDSNA